MAEEIKVKGGPTATLDVQSGPLGVLLRTDLGAHSCWFGSWLAQRPEATNMNLMLLERAASVAQALELAPQVGIPHQNLMVGDRDGHIGWTIFGRIPLDTALRGRAAAANGRARPITRASSTRRWRGCGRRTDASPPIRASWN